METLGSTTGATAAERSDSDDLAVGSGSAAEGSIVVADTKQKDDVDAENGGLEEPNHGRSIGGEEKGSGDHGEAVALDSNPKDGNGTGDHGGPKDNDGEDHGEVSSGLKNDDHGNVTKEQVGGDDTSAGDEGDHGTATSTTSGDEGDAGITVRDASVPTGSDSDNHKVDLVMNASELLKKLEIRESSQDGSFGSDDLSSSIESTANSGAVHSQDDNGDDEGTSQPKKRIDLRHHFVRGIVKIQHDRDEYEKQCQMKKHEAPRVRPCTVDHDRKSSSGITGGSTTRRSSRRTSAPGTPLETTRSTTSRQPLPPPRSQRQFSFGELAFHQGSGFDKGKQQPLYRPPNRREAEKESEIEPSFMLVKALPVTPRRPKTTPEGPSKLPANLKITLSAEGREVRELSEELDNLPSSFEFKATAVQKHARGRTVQDAGPSSQTPRSESNHTRTPRPRPEAPTMMSPLPPKDKPFAGENTNARWSDIVDDDEAEKPSLDTPRSSRQRKPRHKKGHRSTQTQQQSGEHSDADSQVKESPRRSVFDRLGPRTTPPSESSRSVYYESSRGNRNSFAAAEESGGGGAGRGGVATAAAYRDSKQKRTRLELYVPRRGGSSH